MAILIGAGLPLAVLLVMNLFGMVGRRNFGWVALCLLWGVAGFGASFLASRELAGQGFDRRVIPVIFSPLIQQAFVALGAFLALSRKKFDNLVDGAVFGFAVGLGYAASENVAHGLSAPQFNLGAEALRSLSATLAIATASGIVGVAMTQFYFRHRANRLAILLSGLGAAIGYTALFNLFVSEALGGDLLPVGLGVGGFTLVGLYVTGQLRRILVQLAIEKKRADNLLEIVIPIGVQLSAEKNFSRLLENMLVEAKKFCNADAGTLYLVRGNALEFAVMRNDTLRIATGGATANEITLPGLHLYEDAGTPNHHNIATHAALSGKTVNIEDAYETKDFDFSGTRAFDRTNGYQSISFLTIPLNNSEGSVMGVLQLINALDSKREIIPFDANLQQLMESFSALACAALEGYLQEQKLRNEIQKLRIEIDAVKRETQVAEITDTEYFRNLQDKAKEFRNTAPKPDAGTSE